MNRNNNKNQNNKKQLILQSIPFINEWLNNQQEDIKLSDDFKELNKIFNEICEEQDYTEDSYEDIRYLLRPFVKYLPLKIKRIYNISTMDYYSMFIASMWFNTIDDHINLILGVKRFNENMTKFHYNPISLTKTTRNFFPNIQTFYIYCDDDYLFKTDNRILQKKYIYDKKYGLYLHQINKLEKWTGLKCGNLVFDSTVDNWSQNTSVFNKRIIGKSKLVFIVESNDDEVFGYYCDTKIYMRYNKCLSTNSKTFHFNLKSNGRLPGQMKFEITNFYLGSVVLFENYSEVLIDFGNVRLFKENYKNKSFCGQDTNWFNYHLMNKALCGKTGKKNPFIPKRIIVIQMK